MSLYAKVASMPVDPKLPSPVTSLSAQFESMSTLSTGKKQAPVPASPMAASPSQAGSTSPRRKLNFAGLFDKQVTPVTVDGFDPDLQGSIAPIVGTPSASLKSLFDAPLMPSGEDSNDSISSQLSCSPSFFRATRNTPSSSAARASPSEFLDPNSMNIQTPRSSLGRSKRLSLGSRSRLIRTPPGSHTSSTTRCSLQFAGMENTPDLFEPRLKRAKSFAGGKSRRSVGCRKRPASPATPLTRSVKRRSLSNSTRDELQMESAMDCSTTTSTCSDNPTLRWRRYHSDSETVIKNALQRAEEQTDLIADFSKPYCLPLTESKHSDLKAINSQTMVDILEGKFDDVIEECITVDCRYPYEYSGGHIQGALNIYTKQQALKYFFTNREQVTRSSKRTIIVMHCEFSSERGPKMLRFLRAHDRELNKEMYPKLNFPEIYVLEGGYKAFFEHTQAKFCSPQTYKPMLHADHGEDLKYFRKKSKSMSSLGGQVQRGRKGNTPIRSLSFC